MTLLSSRLATSRQATTSHQATAMNFSYAMSTLAIRSADASEKKKVKGVVDWYDPKKGFGWLYQRTAVSVHCSKYCYKLVQVVPNLNFFVLGVRTPQA